jgi:hypothetical protein
LRTRNERADKNRRGRNLQRIRSIRADVISISIRIRILRRRALYGEEAQEEDQHIRPEEPDEPDQLKSMLVRMRRDNRVAE